MILLEFLIRIRTGLTQSFRFLGRSPLSSLHSAFSIDDPPSRGPLAEDSPAGAANIWIRFN